MSDVQKKEARMESTYEILKIIGLLVFISALNNGRTTSYLFGLGLFIMGLFGPTEDRIIYTVAAVITILVGLGKLIVAVLEALEILGLNGIHAAIM
jgi:hypothetical protein